MQPTTLTVPLADGRAITAPIRWQGDCLCVHPPIKNGAVSVTPGFWIISDRESGLAAGRYTGTLRAAITLARRWDAAFADAIRRNGSDLSRWQYRYQWRDQVSGIAAPDGPMPLKSEPELPDLKPPAPRAAAIDGDGAEQYPAAITIAKTTESRVRYSRVLPNGRQRTRNPETGAPVRMDGDVAAFKTTDPMMPELRLWFRGAWHPVPSIAQFMEWTLDSICPNPDGDSVEPDDPTSWLSLVGLI